MNEYNPSSCLKMKDYINRNSYNKAPVVYGPYYTALPPKEFEKKDNHLEPVFDKQEMTIFPRMWNYTNSSYEDGYVSWVNDQKRLL
jgi:hypothetical protein